MYYSCIAYTTIDSIMKMGKKYYQQVYLEECKYKIKKIQIPRFINAELESDLGSDLDLEQNSEAESEYNTKH